MPADSNSSTDLDKQEHMISNYTDVHLNYNNYYLKCQDKILQTQVRFCVLHFILKRTAEFSRLFYRYIAAKYLFRYFTLRSVVFDFIIFFINQITYKHKLIPLVF